MGCGLSSSRHSSRLAARLPGALVLMLMLAPVLLFSVYPVAVLVANSFGVGISPAGGGFTLEHYGRAVASKSVASALGNSVLIAFGSVSISLGLVLPIVLREGDRRKAAGSSVTDAVLTLPIALPGIIVGFFAIVVVGRTGLLALLWEGLSGFSYLFGGMLLAYVYFSFPRVLGPLRGAAASLDPALAECARTLGASRLRVFATVTFPILLPAIIEACATATAVALGGYGTVATLSEGLRLLPLNVVNELTTGYKLADSSTLAVILALAAVAAILAGRFLSRCTARAVSRT